MSDKDFDLDELNKAAEVFTDACTNVLNKLAEAFENICPNIFNDEQEDEETKNNKKSIKYIIEKIYNKGSKDRNKQIEIALDQLYNSEDCFDVFNLFHFLESNTDAKSNGELFKRAFKYGQLNGIKMSLDLIQDDQDLKRLLAHTHDIQANEDISEDAEKETTIEFNCKYICGADDGGKSNE